MPTFANDVLLKFFRDYQLPFLGDLIYNHKDKEPDEIIHNKNGDYLHRWFIQKDREKGNVYLHRFIGDDDDRALHDHPWESVSYILYGVYLEYLPNEVIYRHQGDIIFRDMTTPHRVELVTKEAWTLFITGPRKRDWGFICDEGWKHYEEFQENDGC